MLDVTGACCKSGVLNGCGKCDDGAKYFTDVVGKCCMQLDAAGFCCNSVVDVCGVCGGVGACAQKVEATIATPAGLNTADLSNAASSTRQSLDNDLLTTISGALSRSKESVVINAVRVSSSRLLTTAGRDLAGSALAVQFTLSSSGTTSANHVAQDQLNSKLSSASGSVTFQGVSSTSASGTCGNNVCEVGERCDARDSTVACCKADCPIPIADCPVGTNGAVCNGQGSCITETDGSTSCACYSATGYTGSTCSACADGFVLLNDKCVRTSAQPSCKDGVRNGDETGVDCGGSCAQCQMTVIQLSAIATGIIAGAIAFCCILTIAVGCAVYCCCRKRHKTSAPAPDAFPVAAVPNSSSILLDAQQYGGRRTQALEPVYARTNVVTPLPYSNPMHTQAQTAYPESQPAPASQYPSHSQYPPPQGQQVEIPAVQYGRYPVPQPVPIAQAAPAGAAPVAIPMPMFATKQQQ